MPKGIYLREKKMAYCIDCKKLLSKSIYKRCKKCSNSKENHPNYKDGRTYKKSYCIDCNKEICYISIRCQQCAYKKELNSGYIDGRSNSFSYSPEFINIKDKIRKRDNYTCQICNITEKEHIEICKYVLSVHHIDYDKENNQDNNLISICLSCHIKTNYNRNYWTNYFRGGIKCQNV